MSGFLSDPQLHVMSMVIPVGNRRCRRWGRLPRSRTSPIPPSCIAGLGDGTTQQGEFLEALGEAVREQLPLLFVVQNNRCAISTTTAGRTFFLAAGRAAGRSSTVCRSATWTGATWSPPGTRSSPSWPRSAEQRGPALVVLDVERLSSHTNADDHTIYRERAEIRALPPDRRPAGLVCGEAARPRAGRPRSWTAIRQAVEAELAEADRQAAEGPEPEPVFDAKRPLKVELTHPSREHRGQRRDCS